MASTNPAVIHTQPQPHPEENPTSAICSQQQMDENGELIIMEGICDQDGLKVAVSDIYHFLAVRMGIIWLPIVLPMGIFCGAKAVGIWRVYLTSTSLHFVDFDPACVYFPIKSNKQIALTDIEQINLLNPVVRAGFRCCAVGTKLGSPTTVQVEIKPNGAKEFFPLCCRCCATDLPIVIKIDFCANAVEFVEAVKQQMVTMARE